MTRSRATRGPERIQASRERGRRLTDRAEAPMLRAMPEVPDTEQVQRRRMRAGKTALVAGVCIFAAKFVAYLLTGSSAIFADAMESTVNVVAAGMLVFALSVSGRPPDEGHPYGHGKAEFLSAAIEGAAIAFAALVIITESIRELIAGPAVQRLDVGIAVLAASTLANAVLGVYLVRVGRSVESAALSADGRHVLTDVWTSAGVIVALFVVHWTGWLWADPLVAIAVAINVAWEGHQLIQEALAGLMDEADPEVLDEVASRLESARSASWIDLHGLRSWKSGARRHVDLHLTVPRYLDVDEIHAIHDRVEAALLGDTPGDVVVHFDPCVPSLCRSCGVEACPIRSAARTRHFPFTVERAVRTDEQLGHHTAPVVGGAKEARA